MVSSAGALRKARRKARLADRARRNAAHFDRMTAQETQRETEQNHHHRLGQRTGALYQVPNIQLQEQPNALNTAKVSTKLLPALTARTATENHDIAPPRFLHPAKNKTTAFCFTNRPVLQYDANRPSFSRTGEAQFYCPLDGPKPRIISSSVAGTGGRELRRGGARPGAVSRRIEPADGRDRKRQIHCGGCTCAGFGRARLGRYGAFGRRAGARGGHF